ncbi:MAG: hypothetical protein GY870_16810 [archaeon]|nr:hypothetical protein [archaeon]
MKQDFGIKQDSDINRLLDACSFKETDRVPSFEHYLNKRSMIHFLGEKRIKKIMKSKDMKRMTLLLLDLPSIIDKFVKYFMKYFDIFNVTGFIIWQTWKRDLFPWMSCLFPPKVNLELLQMTGVDAATPMITWDPSFVGKTINPKIIAIDQNGLKEKKIEKLKIPPHKVEKMLEMVDWYIEEFKGTGVGVGPCLRSCFCNTYQAIGMENFLVKCYKDIEYVERILDIFADYSVQITKELSKRDIDCFWLDDDLCMNNGFLTHPKFIKKLWIPRTKAMLKPLIDKGIPIYMHCCGNVEELIPIIIDMGITALHPIQPNCNDIYELKKKYHGKMTLVGNMDLAGVLSFGTPSEVAEDTKKHIDNLSPRGGYVVCSSHSIVDSVPPENYVAMVKATQTHKRND